MFVKNKSIAPSYSCCIHLALPAGIDDVTPRQKLLTAKASTISSEYKKCDDFIAAYNKVGGWVVEVVRKEERGWWGKRWWWRLRGAGYYTTA
jgi:hypothetical protein